MTNPRSKAIIIVYIAALGSAVLATYLFLQGRNYPAIGWTILTFVFICFIFLEKYLRQKETQLKDYEDKLTKSRTNVQAKRLEHFVVLLSSQNPVKVYAIKDVLCSHNIECVVLDSHASQMMGFLPDAKMRVMVPSEDFDESAKIVDSIRELKDLDT